MASAPAHIEDLLNSDDRYEVSSLEVLESFLDEQMKNGTYFLDANLAILKLYLLYPKETKEEVLKNILLKALMAFPAPDFSLCMYQIPEKYHASVKDVIDLAQQLEMAKFKTFWKLAAETKLLKDMKDWEAAVHTFIAGVVSATYRSIKSDELLEILSMSAPDLEKLMKANGWTRSKEDKSVVIVNTETFKPKKQEVKEPANMTLEQYTKMFVASSFQA
mmetsp:Transcript_21481/g.54869  ORF Transcript_21481/g.54869 Transcript_21481/m.54869 type:complete len:219 (+) Transcript_21481:68-724(+)|eukprot:CAMPEP_0183551360 /NCGR_PEP_ID=MMETSP0371-20130417/68598_1 /TAXON_ID=268820 /ORGANISM="Peridinium aciculiferum, Strain PAER-2" /LENGTH=218 /DNA_ID=CAMNT_0025755881 /DNA_START=65 /DNA_END=721 /DNA_ORIENTATION=-